MPLSPAAETAAVVVKTVNAIFSIFGSTLIISQVTRNKRNLAQMQQQIVLGMSVTDIIFSTAWLFPKPGQYTTFKQPTCNFQGFLLQFSLAAVIYNGMLSVYYLLVIKFQYKDLQLQKFKRWLHILPTLLGLGTAVVALVLKLYNPGGWNCWINPIPTGCQQTFNANGAEPTCVRGDNASVYQIALFYGPLWSIILFAIASMATVYIAVRRQEKKAEKFCQMHSNKKKRKKRRLVLFQSFFYIGAFLITWIFPSSARLSLLITNYIPPWLSLLAKCFAPVQGLLNCVAYFRPRYLRCKEESGKAGYVVAWNIVKIALGCCDCSSLSCNIGSSSGLQNHPHIQIFHNDDTKDIEGLPYSAAAAKRSATDAELPTVTPEIVPYCPHSNVAKNTNCHTTKDVEFEEDASRVKGNDHKLSVSQIVAL